MDDTPRHPGDERFCPECGYEHGGGVRFCPNCGAAQKAHVAPSPKSPKDAKERRLSRKGRRWAKVLAVLFVACVLLFYVVIRPFVAEPFEIYAEGMLPTLKAGDLSLVDKVSYRFSEPERGDIIVFRSTEVGNEDRIKRVVGLPGDNVENRDGVLFVNGERQEEPYVNARFPDSGSYGPITVPPGHVFVMGDNRAKSRDSRYFGPIPFENIEGKVFLTA